MSGVASVVVTYNRKSLLIECIHALRNQTLKPNLIIVVNNGSTDGTTEWLNEQSDLYIIHQENVGGAGGFYRGITEAYHQGFDWIWIMDDDTLPHLFCLEGMINAKENLKELNQEIGWLCSRVLWKDGSLAKMNGAQIYSWGEWLNQFPQTHSIPAKSCSFVSVMFNKNAITSVGFPLKEYFMWLDDTEYTRRFHTAGFTNFLSLESIAYHQTLGNTDASFMYLDKDNKGKYFFGVRNTPSMLKNKSKNNFQYLLRLAEYVFISTKSLFRSQKMNFFPWFLSAFVKGLFFHPKIEKPSNL